MRFPGSTPKDDGQLSSKGRTSICFITRNSLEIEANHSCPTTSDLPSSNGPFLSRMENLTANESKERVYSVHTELLEPIYNVHINFLKNFRELAEHFCKGA